MEREVRAALEELSGSWIINETAGADFSDKRLDKRYRRVLSQMSRMPQAPLNQSSECLSETLAAYRFIDNAKVTEEQLLEPHRQQVARRASEESTVLLIQDTSYFDYSDHFKCTDLRPMKIKKLARSLWLHNTLCVLPNGLPLGVIDAQFLTGNGIGTNGDCLRSMEDKLSNRWLKAVENCAGLFPKDLRKVWICDREADIYELLDKIVSQQEDFIIRSKYPREIEDAPYFNIQDSLKNTPYCGYYQFKIGSNGSRASRIAEMAVKFIKASVCVPAHREKLVQCPSITTYIVEAKEVTPPEGEEPIHWRLLTTLEVTDLDSAIKVISWYQRRWSIEEFFKILKSGCRVEQAQFETTKRLSKYITLSLIVAWRIYFLVHLNRIAPDEPAELVVTASELETLQLLLDDKRREKNQRRMLIKTAAQALREIASLGGHFDRKNDPYPGTTVIWRGTMALAYSTRTFLAQKRSPNSRLMYNS